MEAQDYPIRHFEQMGQLATELKALSAQVLEHSYSYDSFGSWWMVIRVNGIVMRVVLDGRERELGIERSTSRKSPYTWEPLWRKGVATQEGIVNVELMAAIRRTISAADSERSTSNRT